MEIFMGILSVLILLFLLFLFLICPRLRHPKGSESLVKVKYAHRGLHGSGENGDVIPENSLAAFRAAAAAGYGMEFDVNLSADEKLVVMHDNNIRRMCGEDRKISESTLNELASYRLDGTDEPIPTLEQTLEAAGGAPLLIELKTVGDNWKTLCERTFEVLDHYEGPYCIESFDPRVLYWLRRNRPEVLRGQLSMNYLRHRTGKGRFYDICAAWLLTDVIARPDFIAYCHKERRGVELPRAMVCAMGAHPFFWTIRNKEEGEEILKQGGCIIFETYRA